MSLRTNVCIRMGYDPASEIRPPGLWRMLHAVLQLYKHYNANKTKKG